VTSEDHSAHEQQDERLLRQLQRILEADPGSREANELIADLIVGWRRLYEPWLVLKAGRQIADPVVSTVELRLVRLLRRKQQFSTTWRQVVWAMVWNELASERRRLTKRAEKETAVGEVFGSDGVGIEPISDPLQEIEEEPDYDLPRLRRARAQLSPDDNELLRLLFEDDLDRMEAAARLGVTPGNLSTKKSRALERLRAAWDQEGEDV
jgi:RNA polymerase sigma factor (sigma-70 family)